MILIKQCRKCNSTDIVVKERSIMQENDKFKKDITLMCHNCGCFLSVLSESEKNIYIENGYKLDLIPKEGCIEIDLYFTGEDWDIKSPSSLFVGRYYSISAVNSIAQNIITKILGFNIPYLEKTYVDDATTVVDFGYNSLFYVTIIRNGVTNIPNRFKPKKSFKVPKKRIRELDEKPISEIMWNELKYDIANDELYDIMENIEDKYNYKDSDFM